MDRARIFLLSVLIAASLIAASSIVLRKFSDNKAENMGRVDKAQLIYEKAQEFVAASDNNKAIYAFNMLITQYPDSEYMENILRNLGGLYFDVGNYEKAFEYYNQLLRDFPEVSDAGDIRARLDEINAKMMQTSSMTEGSVVYVVQAKDTLIGIAKKHNTTVGLIKKMNGLKDDVIRIGQKLKISKSSFSILVDKSQNILTLKKDNKPFKTYIVATGQNNSTPVGVFTITDKVVKPMWTKPGVGIIMPDSEKYELGERWIALSVPKIGIHGTNDESSIGKQSTAGCVRMLNRDVIELYDIVPKGAKVEIVD